jgi:maltooligosyltrehalose trehalohydrolase
MTPMLLQGEEWGASTPFQYFTDHDPELGRLISRGRRDELAAFAAFAHAEIPDPQAVSTFAASVLDRDERDRGVHARLFALHQAALALRKTDPVLAHAGRAALAADAHGSVLVVKRWVGGASRVLVANLSDAPATTPVAGRVLLSSTALELPALPPWSAAIVAPVAT